MAELPKDIRKPSGELVSSKRPHGRRLLLPTEVELCNLLGISEDEYWIFVDQTAAYNGQRPKGYELIPDIRCDPVTTWVAANIVNIGIAIVAAAISYALSPKPKELKDGGTRRTADAVGNTRFSPQASFNSLQELATIGDIIPLVFTNQLIVGEDYAYLGETKGNTYGGVRVNGQLLWSQLMSLGKYQRLKALILFSHGRVLKQPDYEGFAIGDTLLSEYNSHKVGLYFRIGDHLTSNRITEEDRYAKSHLAYEGIGQDPFIVNIPNLSNTKGYTQAFSGTRNPTTQSVFGVYSPIPNGQTVRLPYELVRDSKGATKESIRDLMRKRKKVEFTHWPVRAGVIKIFHEGEEYVGKEQWTLHPDVTFAYQIVGGENHGEQKQGVGHGHDYEPHGVQDVDSMTISIRETIDDLIVVGEQYMFGTILAVCTHTSTPNVPWNILRTKEYFFKVIETGKFSMPANNGSLAKHCDNPEWYEPSDDNDNHKKGPFSLSDFGAVFYRQYISGPSYIYTGGEVTANSYPWGQNDLFYGYNIYTGYKVALATITNNRKCDATEIGIKSKVYKKIQFANVNSQPDEASLKQLFDDSSQIQLGQTNLYARRFSFFALQVRKIGYTYWQYLANTSISNHTGLFVIEGNNPEFLYNSITIVHPAREQYEYRFKPFCGNYLFMEDLLGMRFCRLETGSSDRLDDIQTREYEAEIVDYGTFTVRFQGDDAFEIDKDNASNAEWQIGEVKRSDESKVIGITHNSQNIWWEEKGFTGEVVIDGHYGYKTPRVDNDGSHTIILWNKNNEPYDGWATEGGKERHQWEFYYGTGSVINTTFPNDITKWRDVLFVPPEGVSNGIDYWRGEHSVNNKPNKYTCADPDIHMHYEDNDHKFHVMRSVWGYVGGQTFQVHYEEISDSRVSVKTNESYGTGLQASVKVYKLNKDVQGGEDYIHTVLWTIDEEERGTGYKNGQKAYIPWTDGYGTVRNLEVDLTVKTKIVEAIHENNFNPYDAIADWNVYEGDQNSNRNEPEHEVVFVNEILSPAENADGTEKSAKYNDLAFAGIRINSSKEWTNFNQFSAYFRNGIAIEKINVDGTSGGKHSSSLFPEIAYALLTNSELGAGKLVGIDSVDKKAMGIAARFCLMNRLYWDGVISSKLNLRDFLFEHAGYCLLDFTIIGGKFSLRPSVPYNTYYEIDKRVKPEIKCLFTDGNINDLKVSFLSPEERQTFQAVVLYRNEKINGFPETRSLLIRESDPYGSETDPVETFDLSGFCTSRAQAVSFASFAIKTRRLVDHGLTFKTAPQYVQGLAPGDYFRLVSEVTHTSRFKNGAKLENGTIVSNGDVGLEEDVYYWITGTEGVRSDKMKNLPNSVLFTVKNSTTENKVYKCETISYGEDGLLEVAGSFAPTEPPKFNNGDVNPVAGQLSVLQGWNLSNDNTTPSDFFITEN
jgi:hypothetical protein